MKKNRLELIEYTESSLNEYFETRKSDPSFFAEILSILKEEAHQRSATWLLKRYLESGGRIEPKTVDSVFENLAEFFEWESRLHLLQSLPYLTVSPEFQVAVEAFIRGGLKDKNKFVRAWSYNGFYLLSKTFPEYVPEVIELFRTAVEGEPASVKARLRQIMKTDNEFKNLVTKS